MTSGRLKGLSRGSPGIGKTYAMLEDGLRLRAEGRDLVIAYVEPHARVDTTAMIETLEERCFSRFNVWAPPPAAEEWVSG